MTFADLARKLRAVDILQIVKEVLRENEPFVIELNQQQMFEEGIRADGTAIEPDYSPTTIRRKQGHPGQGRFVDLYSEGDFYGAMREDLGLETFGIQDSDSKTQHLLTVYGDVLGLTPASLNDLRKLVIPIIEQRYKERFDAA